MMMNAALTALHNELSIHEQSVLPAMKTHFGKDMFVVFISCCDTKSRAHVFIGIGRSFDTSWKSAEDRLKKRMKVLKKDPIWFKADLVSHIEPHTLDTFLALFEATKTNYFRQGLALDPLFSIAFMEQELQANCLVTKDRESGNAGIHVKNILHYLKYNLGIQTDLRMDMFQSLYIFRTISCFHDGEAVHLLGTEDMNHGRRLCGHPDHSTINRIIDQSSQYLASQINQSGRFRYGYFPCFDQEIPGYNILRHASTTYAMIESYEVTQNPSLADSIQRSLEFLTSTGMKTITDETGAQRSYIAELDGDRDIKLGANAAAILALTKYMKVFADSSYLEICQRLANGIETFQDAEDGSFVHILGYPDLNIKERHRIIYYNGEAAFALMRLYELDPQEKWINMVKSAFQYFIGNDFWKHHDHWLSYCSYELYKHVPDSAYAKFNLQNAAGILDFCLSRETTYPTLLELLMATSKMVRALSIDPSLRDLLQEFDIVKLQQAISHRVAHQLNGFLFPEVAMYFKVPEHILHGFFIRHHSFRVRIDDVEHNLSGYCSYLHDKEDIVNL
jgi:hypothetical protein